MTPTVDIEVEVSYEARSLHRITVHMDDALGIADAWDSWLEGNYDKSDWQKAAKFADLLCRHLGEEDENYLNDWTPDQTDEVDHIEDVQGLVGRSTCNEAAMKTFQTWLKEMIPDPMRPTPGQLDIFGNEIT